MESQREWRSTKSVVVGLLLACFFLCAVDCSNAQENPLTGSSTVHTKDCCPLAHQAAVEGKSDLTIVAQEEGTSNSQASADINTAVLLNFMNCAIPSGMDITIVIPSTQQTTGTPVFIQIVNTSLESGGSFIVVPQDDGAPEQLEEPTALQNIDILVRNASLTCVGDVLVVKSKVTSSTVVRNVTMRLEDAVLTSSGGSVASVQSRAVDHLRISIDGNQPCTLEAKYLVASVQANRVTNAVLALVMNSDCPPAGDHLVRLVAGGSGVDGSVGVLAVFPFAAEQNELVLYLQDVHILVGSGEPATTSMEVATCHSLPSTQTLQMAATVHQGAVATAGIALQHPSRVSLMVTGNITIEMHLHHLNAFALVMEATAVTEYSVVSVGGISALAYYTGPVAYHVGAAVDVWVENCALRVSMMASSLHNTKQDQDLDEGQSLQQQRIIIAANAKARISTSTVFGIALNTYSRKTEGSRSTFTVANDSSVIIECSTSGSSRHSVDILSKGGGGYFASSALGLAINSDSFSSISALSIANNSHILISGAFSGDGNVSIVATNVMGELAAAVLGISLNTYSNGNFGTLGGRSDVIMTQSSTLGIVCTTSMSSGGNVVLHSQTNDQILSSSVLGVAINCFSYTDATTRLLVSESSRFTIAASFAARKKKKNARTISLQTSTSGGLYLSSNVLGVSLTSYSLSAGDTNTLFLLSGNSSLVIAGSLLDSRGVSLESDGILAAATFGVALNGHSSATSNATFAIINHSSFTIAWWQPQNKQDASSVTVRTSSKYVAAVYGIAVHSTKHVANVFVGDTCTVIIDALLNNSSALGQTTAATATAAVAGITAAVNTVVVEEPVSSETVQSNVLDVWVGLLTNSSLSVDSRGGASSVVGIMASTSELKGLSNSTAALALCKDESTPLPIAAPNGVAVGTKPTIDGVVVQVTNDWQFKAEETPPMDWCSQRAAALKSFVARALLDVRSFAVRSKDHDQDGRPIHYQTQSLSATISVSPTIVMSRTYTASTSLVARIPTATTTRSETGTNWQPPSPSVTPTPTLNRVPDGTPAPTPNVSTATPPQKTRTVRITTSILLPDNEVAATVVLTTAGASGAVASTLGSGGAGTVVMAGSSVRMMECGLAEDEPRPATFELPIQFAVGSGVARYFAGAALAHALFQCVLLAAPVLLRRHFSEKNAALTCLSMLFCGAHPFFTPAILGACSTVLNNDDDALSLAVAGGSAAIVVALHAFITLAIHRGPVNGLVTRRVRVSDDNANSSSYKVKHEFRIRSASSSSSGSSDSEAQTSCTTGNGTSTSNSSAQSNALLFSAEATKDVLLMLFDGSRHYEKATHRHYSSVETTIYSVISIISGARPQQNCTTAAYAIGVLAAVLLCYIVLIRPLRTRLDFLFSALNSTVLVVLSAAVAISVQRQSEDHQLQRDDWVLKTVEVCLWLISILGFVQLGVQGYWAYYVEQRRRHVADSGGSDDTGGSDSESTESSNGNARNDSRLSDPLLVAVEMEQQFEAAGARRRSSVNEHYNNSNPLSSKANHQH